MSFYLRQPKSFYRLQVGVMNANNEFELVEEINNTSTEIEQVTVDFSNYTGHGRRIAFRNVLGNGANYNYSYNYIDDIKLETGMIVSTVPSNRNVLLEDYTGVQVNWCPDAHRIANEIKAANPDRVCVININQGVYASNTYTTAFGDALAQQTGLTGYPSGTINRHVFTDSITSLSRSLWPQYANEMLNMPSPVNIAAVGTLDMSTRRLNIRIQLYYTGTQTVTSNALNVAVNAYQACHFLGLPECNVHLAHAAVYLSMAPKSNALERACIDAAADIAESPAEPVPLQIRNAPTSLMKDAGYGKGYIYAHDTEEKMARMQCLPDALKGRRYYDPGDQGDEAAVKERLEKIRKWKAGE